MLKILKFVAVSCLCLAWSVASSQEVIHAMTGTVRSIDPAAKTFTLFHDNGSLVTFKESPGSKARASNYEKVLSDATAASTFDKNDAYVIVFYYGMADNPTAVAVKPLGTGPFTATVGTITSFNEKDRLIAVKDDSGSVHQYKINAGTIAESDVGVVEGIKFRGEKGGHVRVVGTATNDGSTALFLNVM